MNRIEEIKERMAQRNAMRPPSVLENSFARILRLSGLKYIAELQIGFYFIDFALPEYKVAIEVDGDAYHHRTIEQENHDARKDVYLRSKGWEVIRVASYDLLKSDKAYKIVKELCWRFQGYIPKNPMDKNREFDPIIDKVCSACGGYHLRKKDCVYYYEYV